MLLQKFDQFEDYIGSSPKHGASIEPGNWSKVPGASFELGGETYHLEANNGQSFWLSGSTSWDSAVFSSGRVLTKAWFFLPEEQMGLGFPGHLKGSVSYTLSEKGLILIRSVL